MLITKEMDYAIRILRTLSGGEQRTAAEISAQELVPQQFAYKIIKKLERAGIVRISRGVAGGCSLGLPLEKVNLYDLMLAMDGDGGLTSCMDPDYQCQWREAHGGCMVHCQLSRIQTRINEELKAYTMEVLIFGPKGE